MKVFLDDMRQPPKGWRLAKTAKDTISLIKKYNVSELSLDYDLGAINETGHDVLLWLEKQIFEKRNFKLPKKIKVHTTNPLAYKRMMQTVEEIYDLYYIKSMIK